MLSFYLEYLFDLILFYIIKDLIDDQNIIINANIDLLRSFSEISY
jgi:hypothetical protein